VAGVQLASRQHSSLEPFFQGMPLPLTQLSTVFDCAKTPDAEAASVTDAKSDATLFSFFMILLSREGAVSFCKTSEPESESAGKPSQSANDLPPDSLCQQQTALLLLPR